MPDAACTAQPGTEDKIEVLIARAAARRSLWHPADPFWSRSSVWRFLSQIRPQRMAIYHGPREALVEE